MTSTWFAGRTWRPGAGAPVFTPQEPVRPLGPAMITSFTTGNPQALSHMKRASPASPDPANRASSGIN